VAFLSCFAGRTHFARTHFVRDWNEHQAEGGIREKLTFVLKKCCYLLLCTFFKDFEVFYCVLLFFKEFKFNKISNGFKSSAHISVKRMRAQIVMHES
jgi:hypothetical protein